MYVTKANEIGAVLGEPAGRVHDEKRMRARHDQNRRARGCETGLCVRGRVGEQKPTTVAQVPRARTEHDVPYALARPPKDRAQGRLKTVAHEDIDRHQRATKPVKRSRVVTSNKREETYCRKASS